MPSRQQEHLFGGDDPALRQTLGKQARERVSSERDWRDLVRRYDPVYEAVSRGRRAKP